jgi:monothiol glutaredoxin
MGLLDKILGKKDEPQSHYTPPAAPPSPAAAAPSAPQFKHTPPPAQAGGSGQEAHDRIDNLVKSNKVVLFMKGSKLFPQCGFSAATVEILNSYGVPFLDVDVLSDPGIRQGIKEYAQWPTIPQLFIDGKFVGGCDIAREMHANGELGALLKSGASA